MAQECFGRLAMASVVASGAVRPALVCAGSDAERRHRSFACGAESTCRREASSCGPPAAGHTLGSLRQAGRGARRAAARWARHGGAVGLDWLKTAKASKACVWPANSSSVVMAALAEESMVERRWQTSLAAEEHRDLLGATCSIEALPFKPDGGDREAAGTNISKQRRGSVAVEGAAWNDEDFRGSRSPSGAVEGQASEDSDDEDDQLVTKSMSLSMLLAIAALPAAALPKAVTSGWPAIVANRFLGSIGNLGRFARPVLRISVVTAPAGVVMALVFAVAGVGTAIRTRLNQQEEEMKKNVCRICGGYGQEPCDQCEGRGEIRWEGKMYHRDPCPVCFGSGCKKCTACSGQCCFKKGTPPEVAQHRTFPQ